MGKQEFNYTFQKWLRTESKYDIGIAIFQLLSTDLKSQYFHQDREGRAADETVLSIRDAKKYLNGIKTVHNHI